MRKVNESINLRTRNVPRFRVSIPNSPWSWAYVFISEEVSLVRDVSLSFPGDSWGYIGIEIISTFVCLSPSEEEDFYSVCSVHFSGKWKEWNVKENLTLTAEVVYVTVRVSRLRLKDTVFRPIELSIDVGGTTLGSFSNNSFLFGCKYSLSRFYIVLVKLIASSYTCFYNLLRTVSTIYRIRNFHFANGNYVV